MTTHSPEVLQYLRPNEFHVLIKNRSGNIKLRNKEIIKTAYEMLGAHPFTAQGYVIVEGNAQKALQEIFSKNFHIMVNNNNNGKSSLRSLVRTFRNLGIPTIGLRDRDAVPNHVINEWKQIGIFSHNSDIESQLLNKNILGSYVSCKTKNEINLTEEDKLIIEDLLEDHLSNCTNNEGWKRENIVKQFNKFLINELPSNNSLEEINWDTKLDEFIAKYDSLEDDLKIKGKDIIGPLLQEINTEFSSKIDGNLHFKDWLNHIPTCNSCTPNLFVEMKEYIENEIRNNYDTPN